MNIKEYLQQKRDLVDSWIEGYLPKSAGYTVKLTESMSYSLMVGGKRLRPILCIAGAEALGKDQSYVIPAACAIEFIHTYSLIHDDLPLMDNDDLRRGQPTNHIVFGNPTAILAGDGLLTEAFHILATGKYNPEVSPERKLKVISIMSNYAGYNGMVGGQEADMKAQGCKVDDIDHVRFIHESKTAALISAALISGSVLAGASELEEHQLAKYAHAIGLAFQIADDILDIEGDSKTLGKNTGLDMILGKATYPSVIGIEESKNIMKNLITEAVSSIETFGIKAEPLRELAYYIADRKK